ncbi:MAG: FAD-dependent oxidoreductase, partial [Thermoplasmata archaeon]
IGLMPNTELAKNLGVEMDDRGYIKVDDFQRTSVKGVYAAGDITGGARQIVMSCAQGAQAALASTEVLGKQYPF